MTASEPVNPRVKEAMGLLLKIFDEDNLEKVAHAVFRGSGNIPSDKWSFFNRIMMFMHDTDDARGSNNGAKPEGLSRKAQKHSISWDLCSGRSKKRRPRDQVKQRRTKKKSLQDSGVSPFFDAKTQKVRR